MAKVRNPFDNKPLPNKNRVRPGYSELKYDSGTALSLTTPTAATAMAGMTLGLSDIDVPAAATADHTINQGGVRQINFNVGEIGLVNNQQITVEVYRTPRGGSAVATGIKARFLQPATAVEVPTLAAGGLLACNAGDKLSLRATASTGNFTWKQCNFTEREV